MLDNAFEALKRFDWGTDLAELTPIEDATIAAHGQTAASQDLERRLIASLNGELSRDAKDYVCRKLAMVGSASAVPTLAGLLNKSDSAHMARFALERITAPEAGQALRDTLGKLDGNLRIGVISSLGARRDTAAVASLSRLLRDSDPATVRSAALALGAIGNAESATALKAALATANGNKQILIDARFSCAEALLRDNQPADAMSIYKSLAGEQQERLVRLAATRGLLACAVKQA